MPNSFPPFPTELLKDIQHASEYVLQLRHTVKKAADLYKTGGLRSTKQYMEDMQISLNQSEEHLAGLISLTHSQIKEKASPELIERIERWVIQMKKEENEMEDVEA